MPHEARAGAETPRPLTGAVRFFGPGLSGSICLILGAHPDDETIGAGALLGYIPHPLIVTVTDGAPLDMDDALRAGFSSRDGYAAKRRDELMRALELAGVPGEKSLHLGFTDKTAHMHLVEITRRLLGIIDEYRPALLITHPYCGGHPDHDSASFAAHAASRLAEGIKPVLFEFASYFAGPSGDFAFGFTGDSPIAFQLRLTPYEKKRKEEMVRRFETQYYLLGRFQTDYESFRRAPAYDFTRPPHPWPVFYDRLGWGITARDFCENARKAMVEQGLRGAI